MFVYYERGEEIDVSKEEGNPLIARRGISSKSGEPWKRDKESLKLRFVELGIITGHHLACANDLRVEKLCRRSLYRDFDLKDRSKISIFLKTKIKCVNIFIRS